VYPKACHYNPFWQAYSKCNAYKNELRRRNMKLILNIFSMVVASLLLNNTFFCQNVQTYKHPSLNIQFKASQNWQHVSRPEDKLIFEVMDPDSIVHVVLWYTETEQDAPGYLWKMANMKDLVLGEKPSKRRINNRDTWVLNVTGHERKMPIRMLLAVIPHGKSLIRPKENVLFIIQIWCPEESYEQHMHMMENILDSMEITD